MFLETRLFFSGPLRLLTVVEQPQGVCDVGTFPLTWPVILPRVLPFFTCFFSPDYPVTNLLKMQRGSVEREIVSEAQLCHLPAVSSWN